VRVALVHRDLHALAGGGICTLYRALAPRLRDAGHEVVLIIQHTSNPLVLNGIRVYTLPRTDDLNTHRQVVDQTLLALAAAYRIPAQLWWPSASSATASTPAR
jgi:D-inositol-3-phosphate glycosyltransferase